MVSGFLKWWYLQTFHIGRASLKRNSFNIEMRKVQYFTLAKTPPTENFRNFPCAGSGKFPIFSVATTTENFRNFPCAGSGKFPIFSVAIGCEWLRVAASVRQHSLLSGSHLQPLEWPPSGRQCPPAFSSQRQPLAATRVAAKWPPVSASILFSAAAACSRQSKWPQVAARASGRKWPQVAARASGRKWPQVAARASGRKWPPLPKSNSCPSARSL